MPTVKCGFDDQTGQSGRFAGVHLRAGGQPHFALIGRTFLEDFTMRYEGKTGMVTLSSE